MSDLSQNLINATEQINQDFKEKSIADSAKTSGGKYGYVEIVKVPINPDLYLLVEFEKLKNAQVVPFFRIGMKLRVACVNPSLAETVALFEELKSKGFELDINLASDEGVDYVLKRFSQANEAQSKGLDSEVDENDLMAVNLELESLAELTNKIGISSVKEGINLIELGAMKVNASDIHFQPSEFDALIRFRVDGILQTVSKVPIEVYKQIAQQIKYDAGLKLNVDYVPQDGRLQFVINKRKVDVRISTIPTEFGETIVMRLLDSSKRFTDFVDLGFSPQHLQVLSDISALSQGMILVTGPTGSGKTTTLYSMLQRYNIPEKKVITLEDPVEYKLERIVQSQINEKKGYSFAKALESVLRQDPDVVMIGEIRDLATANTALQAALTGHVVLATLHTNNALESIHRLLNMGLEPFMIAPALDTLIAQRLVRKFCSHCVVEEKILLPDQTYLQTKLDEINSLVGSQIVLPETLPKAVGCEKCSHTGYMGRLVVAEIFRVDDEFKELIVQNRSLLEIKKYALSKGMLNMEQDGVLKVVAKQTSLAEIRRVF